MKIINLLVSLKKKIMNVKDEKTMPESYNGFVHTAAGDIEIYFSGHDIKRDNNGGLIIVNAIGVNAEKTKPTTQVIPLNDIKLPLEEKRKILKQFFDYVCLDGKFFFDKKNITHVKGRNIAITKNFNKYYQLKSLNLDPDDHKEIKQWVAGLTKKENLKTRALPRRHQFA